MEFSNRYIVGFALVICLVCSLAVSSTAVALKDKQDANALLDMQTQILRVAGLVDADHKPSAEHAAELFSQIKVLKVSAETGEVLSEDWEFDPKAIIKAAKDQTTSEATTSEAASKARVNRIPKDLMVLHVTDPEKECFVFLLWGNGLWSTLYGYLAVEKDLQTVRGLTFYEQGETPGLGGEVDNPSWKAQWPGKKIFDDAGKVALTVTKFGQVKDPIHQVNGISGATITSKAVGNTMLTWLSEEGYGKFLKRGHANE